MTGSSPCDSSAPSAATAVATAEPTLPRLARATAAAHEETSKLQKHFGRLDVLFFLLCTLVGVDTIGSVAKNGAQGFTWMAFLAVTFFLPYALLTSELGSAFPDEGGPYVWARLAFGRRVAAISALLYWVSNPIWLGGALSLTAITAVNTFFAPDANPNDVPLKGTSAIVFSLVFIWGTVAFSVLSFKIGKWIPTVGAWARLALLPLFTLAVILYARHHGLQGVKAADFQPDYKDFIAVAPVLFFNFLGFELPSAAGDEMSNPQRDVPFAVLRSALGTLLLYGGPVLAILLVLPHNQVTSLGGFTDAMKAVFTTFGGAVHPDGSVVLTGAGRLIGQIMAVALIFALVSSGATWIMGADRAQAVACYDGAGPRFMGYFSRKLGTPIVMNILSGVISTIVMFASNALSQGNGKLYFQAVLGLAISTSTIAYISVFPALYILRRRYPEAPRPYRVPGGDVGALVCSTLTTFWSVFASAVLLWPGLGVGWFGSGGSPEASLPDGFVTHRMLYEETQFVPLLMLVGLGLLFYALGAQTRKRTAPTAPPSAPVQEAPPRQLALS